MFNAIVAYQGIKEKYPNVEHEILNRIKCQVGKISCRNSLEQNGNHL
jgi:hypothetical protein